jgi:hypothetical protein
VALALTLRYDTKSRVRTPPGPGDMPFAVVDVSIDSDQGTNAYPLGGEPLDFGPTATTPTGIRLFQELHALIAMPPLVPAPGAQDDNGIFVPAFERQSLTGGVLRFYVIGPELDASMSEVVGDSTYDAYFGDGTALFTLFLAGRPLSDAS